MTLHMLDSDADVLEERCAVRFLTDCCIAKMARHELGKISQQSIFSTSVLCALNVFF